VFYIRTDVFNETSGSRSVQNYLVEASYGQYRLEQEFTSNWTSLGIDKCTEQWEIIRFEHGGARAVPPNALERELEPSTHCLACTLIPRCSATGPAVSGSSRPGVGWPNTSLSFPEDRADLERNVLRRSRTDAPDARSWPEPTMLGSVPMQSQAGPGHASDGDQAPSGNQRSRGFARPSIVSMMLSATLFHAACGDEDGAPEPPYVYTGDAVPGLPPAVSLEPEDTGDGWSVSTPEAQGIDSELLSDGLQAIRAGAYPRVDSVVIARNGHLVAEAYFNGYGRDTLHDVRSASKSITSAIVGVAVDQGLLSIDDTLGELIEDLDAHANPDARKAAIRVVDLLNMSSGLACDDWNRLSPGRETLMESKAEWVKFVLDLPMVAEPGERSAYCTGGVVVLGHVVATRAGVSLAEFAAAHLFDHLGVGDLEWHSIENGTVSAGGGMRLRPRDAAKFGELYLNDGVWLGVRVLSEQWVEESRKIVTTVGTQPYGLLWWKRGFAVRGEVQQAFLAVGNGGNYIVVLPGEHLVVAITGSNYNTRLSDQPVEILERRILPALL
jgi:CubicO group peptidase (beta-lactamase class C family)